MDVFYSLTGTTSERSRFISVTAVFSDTQKVTGRRITVPSFPTGSHSIPEEWQKDRVWSITFRRLCSRNHDRHRHGAFGGEQRDEIFDAVQ